MYSSTTTVKKFQYEYFYKFSKRSFLVVTAQNLHRAGQRCFELLALIGSPQLSGQRCYVKIVQLKICRKNINEYVFFCKWDVKKAHNCRRQFSDKLHTKLLLYFKQIRYLAVQSKWTFFCVSEKTLVCRSYKIAHCCKKFCCSRRKKHYVLPYTYPCIITHRWAS